MRAMRLVLLLVPVLMACGGVRALAVPPAEAASAEEEPAFSQALVGRIRAFSADRLAG